MSHEASTGGSSRGKELERTEGNGPAMKGHGPGTAGRVAGEVRELGPRTFTHAVPTFCTCSPSHHWKFLPGCL